MELSFNRGLGMMIQQPSRNGLHVLLPPELTIVGLEPLFPGDYPSLTYVLVPDDARVVPIPKGRENIFRKRWRWDIVPTPIDVLTDRLSRNNIPMPNLIGLEPAFVALNETGPLDSRSLEASPPSEPSEWFLEIAHKVPGPVEKWRRTMGFRFEPEWKWT